MDRKENRFLLKLRNWVRYRLRKPPVPEFVEKPYIRGTTFSYWLRQNQCPCGLEGDHGLAGPDGYLLAMMYTLAGVARYNKWCRKCYGLGIPPTPVNP